MSPFSGLGEQRVEAADRESADDGAPEARHAPDHEHRERDEGEIEVDGLGVDREQMNVQAAGEAREDSGERERDQPLLVDGDADGACGGRVFTRRSQKAPEAARLVAECDADHEERADRGLEEVGRLGHRRERVRARPDLLVVAQEVVGDLENPEGGDACGEAREAHQR